MVTHTNDDDELIPEPPGAREDGIRTWLRAERALQRITAPPPPPRPRTFRVPLRCQSGATLDPVQVDQRMLTRADHGMEPEVHTVSPGPVNLFFLRSIGDPQAVSGFEVEHLLSATVSEATGSYEAKLEVDNTYRDGGSQTVKLLFRHPARPDVFTRLSLEVGENVTTVTLTFLV